MLSEIGQTENHKWSIVSLNVESKRKKEVKTRKSEKRDEISSFPEAGGGGRWTWTEVVERNRPALVRLMRTENVLYNLMTAVHAALRSV